LELDRKIYGNAHPRLAVGLADLGAVEATLGRYAESERLYRESLQIGTAWYGEAQPDLLVERSILATVLVNEGKLGEADSLLRNVLPLEEQVFGKNHAYVAFALDSLGKLAYKRGDLDAAQTYFERSLTISKVLWGDTDFNTGVVKSDLSDAFVGKKQYLRAEELLSQAVSAVTRQPRPGNPSVGVVQVKFGRALVLLKRYRDAEAPLTAGYAILAPKPSVFQERLEQARKDLVTVYTALHEPDQAAKFRSELATNRPK
jgi:tetratricopeptide (TPR) repeat protein